MRPVLFLPGTHRAVVDHFIKEMARLQEKHAAAGKATIFFICSDQQRARCQLRARFGVAAIVEVESDEEAGGGVGEGRVGRGVRAMQHAVAEWLMLAGADVIIRSGKSSFSDEAALAGGVACINVRSPMTCRPHCALAPREPKVGENARGHRPRGACRVSGDSQTDQLR